MLGLAKILSWASLVCAGLYEYREYTA